MAWHVQYAKDTGCYDCGQQAETGARSPPVHESETPSRVGGEDDGKGTVTDSSASASEKRTLFLPENSTNLHTLNTAWTGEDTEQQQNATARNKWMPDARTREFLVIKRISADSIRDGRRYPHN